MTPESHSSALLRTHIFDHMSPPPVDDLIQQQGSLVVDPHPAAVALARRTNTFPGEVRCSLCVQPCLICLTTCSVPLPLSASMPLVCVCVCVLCLAALLCEGSG